MPSGRTSKADTLSSNSTDVCSKQLFSRSRELDKGRADGHHSVKEPSPAAKAKSPIAASFKAASFRAFHACFVPQLEFDALPHERDPLVE